jgi:PAS domain S-box-containing protein
MNPSGIDANDSVAHRSSGVLPLNYPQRYGLAVVSIGVALGVSQLLQHFHFRVPSALLLLFAVAISSWYGTGPAVLAVILSIIVFYWYFVEPVRTIYIYWSQVPYFIIFAALAALLSWFGTIRQRVEKDLREQADLLNLTHDTVFVMDMKGVIKYWNRGAEERYGWTADRAVGKVVHDMLNTVFPSPLEEIKAEVTCTGRWEGELLHTKKGGTQLVVASRWALQRDEQGAPVAILETNNDITERKRAEEALRRLNRELRAISNCNQTLLRATDEQSLLEEICRIVCEEAGYRMAFVAYAEDDDAKSVRPVAWTGAEEGYLATVGLTWADTERGHSPTGTAIRSGRTCCIQDFASDPRLAPWREGLLQRDFRSGIALPLKDEHGNAFGSLTIHSAQPNAFTPEEIRLLEELAADMAFGIVTLRSGAARQRAEQDVALLSFALNNVREAALLIDDTARFHYVNDEACRVLGYTRAELLGMGIPDIDSEFPAERWSDHWRDLKPQRSLNFESRHRTRDGRIFPVEISANYFEYAGQAYNLALARDITERKRAEEELRQSEAELRHLVDVIPQQVFVFDADWSPVFANRRELEYAGLTSEEMQSKDAVARIFHPEDLKKLEVARERARSDRAPFEMEARIRGKDGGYRWFLIRDNPLCDEQGRILRWYGTRTDIEGRKRAEEALRRSDAYLVEAQRLSHTGSWALNNLTGEISHSSEEHSRLYGFDPGRGTPSLGEFLERIHPEDRPWFLQALESARRAGKGFDLHHRVVLPDGSTKSLYGTAHAVINSSGDVTEFVGSIIDITERKQAEEQREKLRQLEADLAHINRVSMMGELATSIAHEVNQPLSGVVSNASACLRWLAGDTPNLEEAREATRRIVRDGKRAGEVIARIRALTKRTVATREWLDLNETILGVLALVEDEAKRKSVMIRTQFAADLSPVSGDRVQLQQVVLNLVMNATDAMSTVVERARELVITARNIDPEQVQVTVEDSGIGIDPQVTDKIFDSFYTTKPGGMGMGLSISRSILQAHGGRLWATTKDGPGTAFHFTLPKYQEEESNAGVAAV